jgi:hypothetical protein
MVEWRRAVLGNDIATLLAFTWPEFREGFGKALKDPQSSLAQSLKTISSLLRRTDTQIVVFEHVMSVDSSDYATACYHVGRKHWPTMYLDLQKLNNQKDMFCLEWVKDERGSWTTSYGFAYGSNW